MTTLTRPSPTLRASRFLSAVRCVSSSPPPHLTHTTHKHKKTSTHKRHIRYYTPQESCLINRKSRATYPKDANDWRWWNTGTPDKLLELVNKGYKLVVFT